MTAAEYQREYKLKLRKRKRATHTGRVTCCGDCYRVAGKIYFARWAEKKEKQYGGV